MVVTGTRAAEIYKLFVGGEWTDASSHTTFDVVNPATLQVIATVPNAGPREMESAIDASVAALPAWTNKTAAERAKILRAAADSMLVQSEHLARIITLEEGKPLSEARGEIAYAASFLEWFAEEGKRVYCDTIPSSSADKRILVLKRPVGVTAAITPWNFPAAMITRKLGPALASGCTMVIKPSELTPLTALEMARIFEEVGLPKGVLSVVVGTDPEVLTVPIMEDERLRKVSFTGSTEVGKILMRLAAHTVKRLSLELGGHAPFIVFDDAQLDSAVDGCVAAKMRNMGETCVAANRIYVQRSIVDEFTTRLTERMSSLRVGDGLTDDVKVGPLIDVATLTKVEKHVRDATSKGAEVLLGGDRCHNLPGYFFQPTVLANANDTMLLANEETFGPLAAILPFDSEEEVVQRANNTSFGLAAYYFTRDIGRVWRLAEQLQYGILGANDGMPSTAQAPFGGLKESGFGREGSKFGIEEYLDVKYVSLGGMTS
ncbi:MAG: NAD-dependent succinate-semialdehyde dehydrogenase [Chloroflexota bacterium]